MYAVIFQAELKSRDADYEETARRMQELARNRYGCLEFVSVCEDNTELTISYWDPEDQIRRWKDDEEHRAAQKNGRDRWYSSYSIRVTEVRAAIHRAT
jgi:heme-degrading monooxygenase HmoA